MQIFLHKNDLPDGVFSEAKSIAVDTEAMGLMPHRDRLCLVQMSAGDGICHLVQTKDFEKATNLRNLLGNKDILKIFHFARFDVMMLYKYLGVMTDNIYCTKIASKLVRTYTGSHSLKYLCWALLNVELSKEETCTDWGADTLTKKQKEYAANDVLYLHAVKEKLDEMLTREGRTDIAQECFDFLPARVIFDLWCGETYDIFSHH